MKHHALQLYDYHVWANQRIVERLKELPEEICHKEIQSVFSSISEVLTHIYLVDTLWLSVMSGDSFDETMVKLERTKEETKGKTTGEMQTMFLDLSKQYKEFLDRREDLDQPVTYEHPRFGKLEASLSELVQHVVNHGTYHRGNITAMLRQLGHAGVSTDFVFYLYEMRHDTPR
ncbi:DinB family protein [Lihuaxuella thermophila]|uniref:Uncharacterized damage-inducible protein DinB (Forms a four-helix bundle) n=1 Tax=Lihuaxuella thermophila TaxID=1173111 RepID=A0A1H8IXS2_9BACL|nr:DinB family protein [Lihuaxuella thermophila]SEN73394.1 Uncharacterized damage-inducible protein DinB (forms a four-helix bundle) [Lihuaxuella thermophila]